jgi:hypothetical protein
MNGMKHGKGKWAKHRDSKSNNYEGEYYMDKKQGYGEFNWASGNIYKGNYKNDLRNGNGEMHWTDGSVYKGNWVNGIQHGYGKMCFLDGTVNEGIFDHNMFQGPVNGQHSEIAEESYDDGTQYNSYDYSDRININVDLAENKHKTINSEVPQKRHKSSNKRSKSKSKKKALNNTDDEIDDILVKVKAIQDIENEQTMLRKKDMDRKNNSQQKARQHIYKRQKSKSRPKSKINPRRIYHDSGASSEAKIIEKDRITLEGSIGMTSENEVYNYYNATTILPHVNKNKKSPIRGKKTIQLRTNRTNSNKKTLEPERKMYILNKNNDLSLKDRQTLSKRKLSDERIPSNRLFADREKTIGVSNTLASHGLQNRRSRVGKMSKAALNLSEDNNINNTTTVFPTIDNSHMIHLNFGKYSSILKYLYRCSINSQKQNKENEKNTSKRQII